MIIKAEPLSSWFANSVFWYDHERMFHNFCVFPKGGAQLLGVNAWLSSFTGRLSSRVSLSMGLLLISLYRLILEDLSAQNVRAWRVFFLPCFLVMLHGRSLMYYRFVFGLSVVKFSMLGRLTCSV